MSLLEPCSLLQKLRHWDPSLVLPFDLPTSALRPQQVHVEPHHHLVKMWSRSLASAAAAGSAAPTCPSMQAGACCSAGSPHCKAPGTAAQFLSECSNALSVATHMPCATCWPMHWQSSANNVDVAHVLGTQQPQKRSTAQFPVRLHHHRHVASLQPADTWVGRVMMTHSTKVLTR
jgi:hypothetical protein